MATIDPVAITGLREIQAALKAMDGESQKQLRVVLNNAAQAVVGGASKRVPVKTGRARSSIRAVSSQREAKVSAGGKKAAYYPWLDFGGKTGRHRSVSRPFFKTGRYIYPAYDANKESIGKALGKAIVDMCQNVGLEVEAGSDG